MAEPLDFWVRIDMHGLEILNHRLHINIDDPVTPQEGMIWFNSSIHEPRVTAIRGATTENRALIADDDDFFNRLDSALEIADDDQILIWDASADYVDHQQKYRKITKADFVLGLSPLIDAYTSIRVDDGDVNLDAVGNAGLTISGDDTIIKTFGTIGPSNTIDIQFYNQPVNVVFAGPSTGGAATPTFRSLVDGDMPASYDAEGWDIAANHATIITGNPHNISFLSLGYEVVTTIGNPGLDINIPTEKAVRDSLNSLTTDHGSLGGLADDDHSQYALLAGRTGDILKIDTINEFTSSAGVTFLNHIAISHATNPYIRFSKTNTTARNFDIQIIDDNFYISDTTNGTHSLFIEGESGFIGIGNNTAPLAPLHIKGANARSIEMMIIEGTEVGGGDINTRKGLTISIASGANEFSVFDIMNNAVTNFRVMQISGNVGIGTASPDAKLDIVGAIRLTENDVGFSGITQSSGHGFFYLQNATGDDKVWLGASGNSYFTGGNVGIGTTTPNEKLHVHVGAAFTPTATLFGGSGSVITTSYEPGFMLSQDIGSAGSQTGAETASGGMVFAYVSGTDYNNLRIGTQSNHHVFFRTNNTDKVVILNTGEVGIGTVNPATLLDVAGTITTSTIKITTNASTSVGYYWKCTNTDGSGAWTSVTASQIYKGTWNATTNTPTLADGTGTSGDYYRCVVAGTVDLGSGNITFAVGDDVSYNGTIWEKIPGAGYTLQIATASVLGGVKIGSGVSIDGAGVISVSTAYDPAGTMSTHQSTYNHSNYDTAYSWGNHAGLYIPIASISGTINKVAKFTGTATLGDSLIFDNGTNVGIGVVAPGYPLEVNGVIYTNAGLQVVGGSPYLKLKDSFGTGTGLSEWNINVYNGAFTIRDVKNSVDAVTILDEKYIGIMNPSPIANLDIIGTMRVGVGAGVGSMSPLELVQDNSGLAITSTNSTTTYPETESYIAFFLKDEDESYRKAGAIAVQWTDNNIDTGYGSWNVHETYYTAHGVTTDYFSLACWAKHGAAFSPAGLGSAYAPGEGIVRFNGNNNDNDLGQILITGIADPNQNLSIGYNTTSDYGFISSYKSPVSSSIVINLNGGKVGIGTVPTDYLHIYEPAVDVFVKIDSSTHSAGLLFAKAGVAKWFFATERDSLVYGLSNNDLFLYNNVSDFINVVFKSATGRVGIGIIDPESSLDVAGNFYIGNHIGVAPRTEGAATLFINQHGWKYGDSHYRNLWIGDGKANYIASFDGLSRNVTFAKKVGIGIDPTSTLHIIGSHDTYPFALFHNSSATGLGVSIQNGLDTNYSLRIGNAASNTDKVVLYGNGNSYFEGNMGIGTATPYGKLDVRGSLYVTSSIMVNPANTGHAILYVNQYGYQGASSYFRSLWVGDGKGSLLAYFDGENGTVLVRNKLGIGITVAPTYTFHAEASISGDIIALFKNTSVSGKGINIQNGLDSNYALKIGNAASNADKILLYGNGSAYFDGSMTIASLMTPSGTIKMVTCDDAGTLSYQNIPDPGIVTGDGPVFIAGNPANNQIAIWTSTTDIEGSANFTFDGSNLFVAGTISENGVLLSSVYSTMIATFDTFHTNFDLAVGSLGKIVKLDNTITCTVVTTGMYPGFQCTFLNVGTGTITFTYGTGVTLTNSSGLYRLPPGAAASIIAISATQFYLFGELIA